TGEELLLRPPRRWQWRRVDPCQSTQAVTTFALPAGRATADVAAVAPIGLPLRLGRGSGDGPAELWLLRDDPEEQLAAFVRESDERLLDRFHFAPAHADDQSVILLLGRAERSLPPVFVGAAEPLAAVLKFPNLFAPHGLTLRPPLRRET